MAVNPFASSAKVQQALATIGATELANTMEGLVAQAIVAVANGPGGGGGGATGPTGPTGDTGPTGPDVAVPYTTATASGTILTLALTDAETYIRLTNASACDITLPNQATVVWLADTEIIFRVANTGIPTFTLGGGVTLNGSGTLATLVQNDTFAIKRVASDVWDLI